MLVNKFARLPLHEQKLYRFMALLVGAGLLLGVLWVLTGLSEQTPAADNEWQATAIVAAEDVAVLSSLLDKQPRWLGELGPANKNSRSGSSQIALEGKPESLRLTGLVAKGDKTYALFLPLIAPAGTTGKPAIRQLGEGDTLVGEWVVKRIGHNQVEIQQGDETQTLRMYQPKAK